MKEDYRVYILSNKQKFSFFIGCGFLLSLTAHLFYNCPLVSLLFFCLVYPASGLYSKHLNMRRKKEISTQFRDLLYSLSASMSAGRQMREALSEARKTMGNIYGESSEIYLELINMVNSMQESGICEESVLNDFAVRSGIQDIVSFSDIYGISKSTGVDMERIIRRTINILIDRIDIEREIQTLTAQKRMEFLILTSMPLLTLLFLKTTSAGYIAIMYQSIWGRIIMTFALIAIGTASYLANRITQIKL